MRAAGGPGLLDSEKSPGACPQRAARAPRLAHGWAPRRLSARRGGGAGGSQPAFPSWTRPRSEHTTRPRGLRSEPLADRRAHLRQAHAVSARNSSAPCARRSADSNPSQSAARGRWGVERGPGNGPGEGGLEIVFVTR